MRAQRTALLRMTHGSPSEREGKNSHRPCGAPPSKREASYNHSRKEATPPPAPYICAYLRSSRQGAFCGHSATPNATLFTPVAPLHENLFCKNIFVIAAVLFSKSDRRVLYCCDCAAERKHAVSRRRTRGLSLKITKIFRVSSRKICEHLLFEYRALYVVHVFGDAVVHAHQLHNFVARVDDGGVIAPAHDLADGDEGKRKHIAH